MAKAQSKATYKGIYFKIQIIVVVFQVKWKQSVINYANRYEKYLDPGFFQHRIHWFSIFNSFMMVIFLVGLVSMILMRTLRKDYARYSREEDLDEMVSVVFRGTGFPHGVFYY